MGGEDGLHEPAVDLVAALDGGLDQGLERELVDGPGPAVRRLEEDPAGGLGEQLLGDAGADEVELDVVACVLEAERPELGRIGDPRAERLQRRDLERA